ncbi:low affinity immunoglobulin epsilon Fc receptor-like [Mya arenaria]|uniref:low affinity immunoglobulin epsilon Fc receptor-like n=1 Tax=Mya arenaria TaxID=6604 RepID=UPI0022E56705|nr:low affinity immunoglobulin epsilon Fc receptor-like [Mya arenaria]
MAVHYVGVLVALFAASTTAHKLNQLSKKVNLLEAKVDYEMLNLKHDIETVVVNVSDMMSGDFCGICVNNTNTVLTKSDADNNQGGLTRQEKGDTSKMQGFKLQIRQAFAKEKLFLDEFKTDITEKTTRIETKFDDFKQLLRESDSKQEHMLGRTAQLSEGVDALNASLNESNENTAHLETEMAKMKKENVEVGGMLKEVENTLTRMNQNYESMKSDVNNLKRAFNETLVDMAESIDMIKKMFSKGRTACIDLNGKILNTNCYVKLDGVYNFAKAVQKCSDLISWDHSKVVEIESREENDFIAKNFDNEEIWLGGSDKNSEGTWYWISDRRVWTRDDFKAWNIREPNNDNGGEDCMHLQSGGKWNDGHCHIQMTVVCEFKLD